MVFSGSSVPDPLLNDNPAGINQLIACRRLGRIGRQGGFVDDYFPLQEALDVAPMAKTEAEKSSRNPPISPPTVTANKAPLFH